MILNIALFSIINFVLWSAKNLKKTSVVFSRQKIETLTKFMIKLLIVIIIIFVIFDSANQNFIINEICKLCTYLHWKVKVKHWQTKGRHKLYFIPAKDLLKALVFVQLF